MARKTKESRLQYGLFATPLEEMKAEDNPVRVVDAFVDAMDLSSFEFKAVAASHMGAPSYDPSDLLKIYFFGYFNRIRSSRCLERECARNVEVWLTGRLTPCCHTIPTFRTYREEDKGGKVLHDHRKALVAVFRSFNRFLDRQGPFGKATFAVDGTKVAAQNSKKRHISEDKLARKLGRIEGRISEYLEELDNADREAGPLEGSEKKGSIQRAIRELEANKEAVLQPGDLLQAAQDLGPSVTQVPLTGPGARMLPINNEGMMMVAYNVQSTVDGLHCLVADFSVENQKDNYLLAPMGASVKAELGIEGNIDLLADKYKRRQAIVEHPFGTIKRGWGCCCTLLRRKEKVAGEMAIVFATYNLRRIINIMGATVLINALKGRLFPEKPRIYPFCGGLFICHKTMPIKYAPRRIDLMALCAAA